MKRFAVAALALGLPLLSVATAHADTSTVTISGVAWKDLNGDGIRQADEPVLPGIKIGDTTTDAMGRYTLTDVPYMGTGQADSPRVQASQLSIEGGKFTLTRPHQGPAATDSDFDWVNGWLNVDHPPVDGVLDNMDVGYMPAKSDPWLKALTPEQANPVHVGDHLTYDVTVTTNDFPGYYHLRVAFPDGIQPDKVQETPGVGVEFPNPQTVDLLPTHNQDPSSVITRTVTATVTKPTSGKVTAELVDTQGDVNPINNEKSVQVTAVDTGSTTPPSTTTATPAPTVTTTPAPTSPNAQPVGYAAPKPAALANTGVDPVWPLVAGLTLLAGGAGAIFLARRRRA
ncbi:LPXTG cell wall anchor domain-containing protein [Kutzneria sp. CA-103260]|uniref:LPXTG cell wall anchor domain-containing protein n=1 Tax=Kutzneria sp. CA-103260 TaxID=2802641 RepID=UPI001BADF4DC|nr:LPXTG cell wall anchor domain-containing protein [Kutzneria sp. CA-103260]QUQ70168.1 hypothetical protein JJ691_79430 [Kutzneria sp. CA-103260]